MTPFQHKLAKRIETKSFEAAQLEAKMHGMELTKDSERGFWLKDGPSKRYIRYLEDVSGWIHYLETCTVNTIRRLNP